MSNIQNSFNFNNSNTFGTSSETAVKTFMTQVFAWMSGALMITALTSYLFGNISSLLSVLYRIEGDAIIGMTPIGWAVVFAPLALVHLYIQGYDGEALSNFELSLTTPSVIYEQEKVALWKEKIDLAKSIPQC